MHKDEPTLVTNDRQSRPFFSLLTAEIADCYGAEVTLSRASKRNLLTRVGVPDRRTFGLKLRRFGVKHRTQAMLPEPGLAKGRSPSP